MMILWPLFWIGLSLQTPPALEKIQSRFRGMNSFEVKFEQIVKQDLFPDQSDKAEGELKFTRPQATRLQSMKWEYTKPKKKRILFDGKEIQIESEGETQVIRDQGRISLEKSFAFLWGDPDPQLFRWKAVSAHSVQIEPKRADEINIEWITVTEKNGLVESAVVKDKLGGESRLTFSDWKLKK